MLEDLDDEHFTTELGQFNLEFNLDPLIFGETCLSAMEWQIGELLAKVREAARKALILIEKAAAQKPSPPTEAAKVSPAATPTAVIAVSQVSSFLFSSPCGKTTRSDFSPSFFRFASSFSPYSFATVSSATIQ